MTRALSRRLGRLEEQLKPAEEPRIFQAVFVDSNGCETGGFQIVWHRVGTMAPGLVDSSNRDEGNS
jgi:hypothetical protein